MSFLELILSITFLLSRRQSISQPGIHDQQPAGSSRKWARRRDLPVNWCWGAASRSSGETKRKFPKKPWKPFIEVTLCRLSALPSTRCHGGQSIASFISSGFNVSLVFLGLQSTFFWKISSILFLSCPDGGVLDWAFAGNAGGSPFFFLQFRRGDISLEVNCR